MTTELTIDELRLEIAFIKQMIHYQGEEIQSLKGKTQGSEFWDWLPATVLRSRSFSRERLNRIRDNWYEGIHWRKVGNRYEYNWVPIKHLTDHGDAVHERWVRSQKPYLNYFKENKSV